MHRTSSRIRAPIVVCIAIFIGCVSTTIQNTPLPQLLKTNTPCRVRLQPAWVGDAKFTVRTGFFTNAAASQFESLERELHFDWFSYSRKPSSFHFGPRTISKNEGDDSESAIHAFRASLPSDAELTAATTVSALEKFLGPSQGFSDGWTASWEFFTLKDDTTIETVSVFCMITNRRGDVEWRVDSIKVIRGTAKQKAR